MSFMPIYSSDVRSIDLKPAELDDFAISGEREITLNFSSKEAMQAYANQLVGKGLVFRRKGEPMSLELPDEIMLINFSPLLFVGRNCSV